MVAKPDRVRVGSIRRATPKDNDWICDVAAEVYRAFGDYRTILPSWLSHPGVLSFIEEDGNGTRRGFILLGFYEPSDVPPGSYVADLLAIAVDTEFQGRGIGRRLLQYALDLAVVAGQRVSVPEMRLTVASTNIGAQRLFRRFGFEILDANHGRYDGGQRAVRMRRKLP